MISQECYDKQDHDVVWEVFGWLWNIYVVFSGRLAIRVSLILHHVGWHFYPAPSFIGICEQSSSVIKRPFSVTPGQRSIILLPYGLLVSLLNRTMKDDQLSGNICFAKVLLCCLSLAFSKITMYPVFKDMMRAAFPG